MNQKRNNLLLKLRQSKYVEYLPNLKEEKTQKFTSVVLTFVALSIFGLFAINPTISTIVNLRRQLKDDTFTQEQLSQKISNLSSLGKTYQQIESDLPKIMDSLPQEPQISLLLAQLQSVAQSSGVNLLGAQTFQVDVTTSKDTNKKYSSFVFSISAEGSYNNIMRLIEDVSNMQRVVSLDIISINKKSGPNTDMQVSIKGSAYFKN